MADDLERLVAAVCAGGTDGIDELEAIAKRRPEALRPYHRRLLDAEAWWPEVLFRGMDEATSAYAVRLADEGAEHAVLLLELLAGCGSSTAVEAIRRWVREPPAWTAHLHWPVARYAHVGGWELADGEVRRLTRDATTRLVPVLGGGSPTTDQCRWCGRPWWRLLDLAPGGPLDLAERVAVGTCVGCGGFATLYGQYGPDGVYRWAEGNERPPFLGDTEEPLVPPVTAWGIGEPRPTPLAGSAWEPGGSTLGGHPDWIDDPVYPPCLRCGRAMPYLGMITMRDLWAGPADGCWYLFADLGCRMTATVYQQS